MSKKRKQFIIKQVLLFAIRISIVYVAHQYSLPVDLSLLSIFLDTIEKT